jgi:hypothetical protein
VEVMVKWPLSQTASSNIYQTGKYQGERAADTGMGILLLYSCLCAIQYVRYIRITDMYSTLPNNHKNEQPYITLYQDICSVSPTANMYCTVQYK